MPTNTAKLAIPKPLGTENVTRASFDTIWNTIDSNAQKNITIGTAAPASPVANDLWIDTTNKQLKYYVDATTGWVVVSDATTVATNIRADSTKTLIAEVRTTDPASPAVGQIWVRSDL